MSKLLRPASSLIIISKFAENTKQINPSVKCDKNLSYSNEYDYKILTVKRNQETTAFPGYNVFPGGIIEKADESSDWMHILKDHLSPNFKLLTPLDKISVLPKSISLRISAIRETFEESGILISHHRNHHFSTPPPWSSVVQCEELLHWQSKVRNDPYEFLNLFKSFDLCPDVNSLHFWSNWLTPPSFKRRYNAYFFVSGLDFVPESSIDNTEVVDCEWGSPDEFLQRFRTEEIQFPPPQFYEFSRLKLFNKIVDLVNFSAEQSWKEYDIYMPIFVKCKDEEFMALPGDDLYPDDPNYEDLQPPLYINKTFSDILKESSKIHRIRNLSKSTCELIVSNVKLKHSLLPKSTFT